MIPTGVARHPFGAGGSGPPSRAERDLVRLRRLTRWMDEALRVPGTPVRVGLDALLGLVPGAGDVVGGLVSSVFLLAAVRAGAPPVVLVRMGLTIAVDVLLGAVPVVGDLFDLTWRANARNLALLEALQADPAATARRSGRALRAAALGAVIAVLAALAAALWVASRAVGWILAASGVTAP